MKQMKQKKKGSSHFFRDDAFDKNLPAIRQYNLQFSKLFNMVAMAFMLLMFFSTFVSDYALSLRMVYVFFIVLIIVEEVIVCFHPPKGTWWIMPLCYLGMIQIYAFCILSGVVFNVDSVAINYHVFLILLPLSVLLPFKSLVTIQTLSLLAFSITTFAFKIPSLASGDVLSAVVYYCIGLLVTKRLNKMRVDYLGLYQEHDKSEKQNALLLNETPVGIMKLAFTGTEVDVLYINHPAIEMFGYTEEEFYAKKEWDFSEVVHPEDLHLIAESLKDPIMGKGYTYDFRLKHKATDTYHWVACKFKVIGIEDERITTLTDFLDIDAQKHAEDVSKAKSTFLSRMSHEIRTPINAIMGMAELGRQDVSSGKMNAEVILNYFDETTAASKYLLTLVNDVLDTSRIENDKVELQPVVVNAKDFLFNIATMIEPMAEQKGIKLIAERKTHTKENFIGDPVRVKQILVNILNNAIKFTPKGGTVYFSSEAITTSKDITMLQFIVKDTGIGMTKEFQENLFKPFTQENAGTTSPFEGTGLGLSIARSLAQKMGGDIVCESTKGVGTTFTIKIEVKNTDKIEQKSEISKDTTSEAVDFSGVRVLLCEDHPLNQKIAKALLERRHCTVDVANDGAEGLKMFKDSKEGIYSIIFMDIRMPLMDGLQTTKEIRSLKREDALTVPIVAMSANAYAEDVQKSLDAGMNDHLAKPVDPERLYKTIAFFTETLAWNIVQKKKTILVVDDIEMTIAMMKKVLSIEYNVLEADNGKTALEIMSQNNNIDMVITDIQMPVMDGIELITTMRNDHSYDHIAIIANTQYGDPKQEEKLLAMGADDFVYKPITPKIVATRVRYVMARYQHFYMYRNSK